MKTKSIWEGTAPKPATFMALKGDVTADVVIIGGGITGLTAALLLSDAGKKVVLLEAMRIGLGTTGNSTGNLYVTVDEHLSGIKKKWNAEVMKAVVQSRTAAIDLIEQNVQRFSIDCHFVRTTFNYFAENLTDESEEFLREEKAALTECGLHPEVSDGDGRLPFPVERLLTLPGQAQFHPLKYCQGLAAAIATNCQIYENSAVLDYDAAAGTVRTAQGKVTANAILLATHVPKGVFAIHGVLGPYREFGVAAEVKTPGIQDGIFWGLDLPKHSVRAFSDGAKKYVMVIGDKFKTGQQGDGAAYVERLETFLKNHFEIGIFSYLWGGQQYRSADGLPYIGKHGDKLYFLTGFASDGLVYGTLAARIVSDKILGKDNPWAEMYRADRHTPLKSAKQVVKETANNMAQYLKDAPWNVDAASLAAIHPGEGKLLESSGEKLAVYKDETGHVHALSAVCTHMKCIVDWNDVEKTWDCPCHGSRFQVNGDVIEGPALVPLPTKEIHKH